MSMGKETMPLCDAWDATGTTDAHRLHLQIVVGENGEGKKG